MKEDNIIKLFSQNDEAHKVLMEKLEKFGEKLEAVSIDIAKLPDELTKRFDERYASKETEKALNRIMWIVVTAVLMAVLALVFKD